MPLLPIFKQQLYFVAITSPTFIQKTDRYDIMKRYMAFVLKLFEQVDSEFKINGNSMRTIHTYQPQVHLVSNRFKIHSLCTFLFETHESYDSQSSTFG